MAKRPSVTDAAPGMSSRTPSGDRPAGTTKGVSARITSAKGTLIKKAQRQLSTPTSIPPASAPTVNPPDRRVPFRPKHPRALPVVGEGGNQQRQRSRCGHRGGNPLERPGAEKQGRSGRNAAQKRRQREERKASRQTSDDDRRYRPADRTGATALRLEARTPWPPKENRRGRGQRPARPRAARY